MRNVQSLSAKEQPSHSSDVPWNEKRETQEEKSEEEDGVEAMVFASFASLCTLR